MKIKELVNNSDLPKLQQNRVNEFILRIEEEENKRKEDIELIEKVAMDKNISEIILSNDEVKIYTVKDEDVNYPYRVIFLDKSGKWKSAGTIAPDLDTVFLVYLENKHLGINSNFTNFAVKMLEIKLPE